MLAVFCLRLAAGMVGCLLLLPAHLINPRFYRTHFLTALGLVCLAWLSLNGPTFLSLPLNVTLGVGLALTFAGSFVWALEGAPGATTILVLSVGTLVAALAMIEIGEAGRWLPAAMADQPWAMALVLTGAFTSALALGAALTAMLMGHSYLIAPTMSLIPLLRMIALLAAALLVRMLVEGSCYWWRTASLLRDKLGNDTLLWLPVRWLVGFLLPLGLAWMAWQTTKIRSTQSSTGILYVVVLFVFLGELISLLLRDKFVSL